MTSLLYASPEMMLNPQSILLLSAACDETPPRQGPEAGYCVHHKEVAHDYQWLFRGISLDAQGVVPYGSAGSTGERAIRVSIYVPFVNQTIAASGEDAQGAWLRPVLGELEELSSLPDDWDQEGSPAISDALLSTVASTLCDIRTQTDRAVPAPSIVPVPGGRVQLEWRNADMYFEIEFFGGEKARYLYKKGDAFSSRTIDVSQVLTVARTLDIIFCPRE